MTTEIQIIDRKTARIGDRQFHLFHHEPPLVDGEIFGLEASAVDNPHARNHLKPYELRGISGRYIPAGFSICIERAKTHLSNSSLVYFENLNEGPTLKLWFHFDYATWHMPMHLAEFADVFRADLSSAKHWIRRIDVDESEGTVNLLCIATLDPVADCYETFQALDDAALRSYRTCLRMYFKGTASQPVKKPDSPPSDNYGAKWWLRYVVVPVLVGLIAVIALLLR